MHDLWLGSEASYHYVAEALKRAREQLGEGGARRELIKLMHDNDEDDPNPVQTEVIGNVGVIKVTGGTVTNSSWITRWLGIPSYADIQERFLEMADDYSVKAIVLSIDSPGGAAKGVSQLSDFIRAYSNGVKNVIGFNAGSVCSAALWYGTGGVQLHSCREGETGSVGAIMVHMEYTEALKMDGVSARVFRSAPYKALGNPYEKLEDKAIKDISERIMRSHNAFVAGLSSNLGLKEDYVGSTIANGKVYGAEDAVKLKMVHSIQTFEQLVARLNKKLDNPSR